MNDGFKSFARSLTRVYIFALPPPPEGVGTSKEIRKDKKLMEKFYVYYCESTVIAHIKLKLCNNVVAC